MKIYKRVLTLFLTALMLGSLLSCQAAESKASLPFTDVSADADYAQAVAWCYENGLMNGVSTTSFDPNGSMTRTMLATILYRQAGEPKVDGAPDFTDALPDVWYSNAVVWAAEKQLLRGYGNGLFGVNDPVSKEMLNVVIARQNGEDPAWTGAAELAVDATRAEAAVALYETFYVPEPTPTRRPSGGGSSRPSGGGSSVPAPTPTPTPTPDEPSAPNSNMLVAYFSRAGENWQVGVVEKGNTAIVAEMVAEQTGADLFEICPVTPYPSNYNEMLEVARKEAQENARPEIKDEVKNWDSYDTVFLGYPIWNGDMPNIVYNFLESYDFDGKTIVPFCTHGGSGLSSTVSKIRSTCPKATVATGLAIAGTTAQQDAAAAKSAVEKWIAEDLKDILPKEDTTAATVGKFDLEAGTVLLNNGVTMPILGIGTYQLSDTQAENSVYWALRDGYRLIDTARIYGNEEGVGRGIQRAIDEGLVTREEIFVTTKMWTSDFGNGDAAVDASLRRLNLDYIDLMILHHSQPSNDVQAYQAMERAVADGKLRCVGLSNYYTPDDFDRLVNATTITPVLMQNETHPYHQSGTMKEHMAKVGTVMESWFPLGGRGHTQTLFNDPVISAIAAAHNKTSAQVILRWHLQAGNIAIPGSSNEAHIQENYEIFDFELSEDEMAQLTAINKDQRFASY